MNKITEKELIDLEKKILSLNKGEIKQDIDVYELLTNIPEIFKFIKNPESELEILAVRMLGSNIQYVKEQTPLLQKLAIIDDIENIKFIKEPIQEVEEEAVQKFPEVVSYLENPRDFSILIACTYPGLFKHLKQKSPYICDYAVKKNPENIVYIDRPSIDLQRIAYQSDRELLGSIEHVDEGLLMEIIPNDPYIVTIVKNVTDLQYKMAIKQEPLVLLQLDDKLIKKYRDFAKEVLLETINNDLTEITEELIKSYPIIILAGEGSEDFDSYLDIAIYELPEIIKLFSDVMNKEQKSYILASNGWAIKYIDKNEIDDCTIFLALSNNQDYAVQYIDNPSLYVQRYAIEEHANNIQYIKNPDESIINMAITRTAFAIKYVENPSDFISCKAIRKDPNSIQFIDNQTQKMQFIAYKQNPLSAKYFKNMDSHIKLAVLKDYPELISYPEFKLTADELLIAKINENVDILFKTDKEVVLEYLNRKYMN